MVRARVGAEAVTGQDDVADDEEVALALVDELRLDDVRAAAATEPGRVGDGLGSRSGWRKRAASTAPSTTVAPLAA